MFLISLNNYAKAEQIWHSFLSWLSKFREIIRQKRQQFWQPDVSFVCDNAGHHAANNSGDLVLSQNHPSYSPVFVPSDFYVF